jgi:hypothetical protein
MSIEAMKRALKTFEKIHEGCGFVKEDDLHKDAKDLATYVQEDCDFTMRTLRQAIEQAEQWDTSDMAHRSGGLSVEQAEKQEHQFKYTPYGLRADESGKLSIGELPRKEWVGLTDDEVHKIIDDCTPDEAELEELNDFAKAIFAVEAKLKEKNCG